MRASRITQARAVRIHSRLVDAADLALCERVLGLIPGDMKIADLILLAAQLVGNGICGLSEDQRAEMLTGLFVGIQDQVELRANVERSAKP